MASLLERISRWVYESPISDQILKYAFTPRDRKLQQSIDLTKLYIATLVREASKQGKELNMQMVLAQANVVPVPKRESKVEASLYEQLIKSAHLLRTVLKEAGDPCIAEARWQAALQEVPSKDPSKPSFWRKVRSSLKKQPNKEHLELLQWRPSTSTSSSSSVSVGTHAILQAHDVSHSSNQYNLSPKQHSPSHSFNTHAAPDQQIEAAESESLPSILHPPHTVQGMQVAQHSDASSSIDVLNSSPQQLGSGANAGLASFTSSSMANVVTCEHVSQAMKQHLGFRVVVKPSHIPGAGLGLFADGDIPTGTVVALLPGIVYRRMHLPAMPNHPRVDIGNPYLCARWDRSIIDSKPWGKGGTDQGGWTTHTGQEAVYCELLEGRHPLALGHFINHPTHGRRPNVLEIPYTIPLANLGHNAALLRVYFPNVTFVRPEHYENDDGVVDLKDLEGADIIEILGGNVLGQALIATQRIHDGEEILQDYRMNPRCQPAWYRSVDPKAEARRWAVGPLGRPVVDVRKSNQS